MLINDNLYNSHLDDIKNKIEEILKINNITLNKKFINGIASFNINGYKYTVICQHEYEGNLIWINCIIKFNNKIINTFVLLIA